MSSPKPILIVNGPNLNLLGHREPEIYGTTTLDDIAKMSGVRAAEYGLKVDLRQSNHEGEIVEWIQWARENACGLIVNAGAFTHTSVAILDALQTLSIPVIEVHLSNIFRREEFRSHSYVSLAATGVICGLGAKGYELAIEAIGERLA
jgi:3-dehydroquinate dehydratase-2